jgi:hypothetical protein
LQWVREHWLTSGTVGVAVSLLGLWLQRRGETQRDQHDRAQRSAEAMAQQARLLRAH